MADIKERIAKLLALADSPNEHEAKRALLKARELMAANNLLPEHIAKRDQEKVVKKKIGVYYTKMTDMWAEQLSAIIAEHYCCKSFNTRAHRAKKRQIGFVGLEDNFEICVKMFRYAYDCVKTRCDGILSDFTWLDAVERRKACYAYGMGFCDGLLAAFAEQTAKHQKWGLVMVTPKQVEDALKKMEPPTEGTPPDESGINGALAEQGRMDGKKFDPERRIDKSVGRKV